MEKYLLYKNKKTHPILLRLSFLLILTIVSFKVSADVQQFTIDGITYEYSFDSNGDNESLTVVSWDESIIDLVIPEGIELPDDIETPEIQSIQSRGTRRYKFITLFQPRFYGVVPVTENMVIQGVKTLIVFDFSSLVHLQTVSLSPDIEAIPAKLLKGCKNIKSYEIGSKVKEIGEEAFAGTGLEKIRIPASVKYIGQKCFENCENLTELTIESNEEQNCYPDFVINQSQFRNCYALESITIGAGVSRINIQDTFGNCNAVREFTISSGPDNIYIEGYYKGQSVFANSPLKKLTINRNFDSDIRENIPNDHYKPSPFSDHPTLEEVEIGGYTTRLNMEAFKSCPNLHNIEFKVSSLEAIGDGAFKELQSLKKITLPYGIEFLSDHIFEGCENLVEVNIPTSVKEIREYAFHGCKSLPNPPLHEGLEALSLRAFKGCSSFTELTLPNSLKKPGSSTFQDCVNLSKVTIGTGLESINCDIFHGCPILYDIVILDGDDYWNLEYHGFATIPIKNLYLGRNHNYVTSYYAYQPFASCETLTNVTIGDNITEIHPWSFYNCTNLSNVSFGNSIEKIGEGAFYQNNSLTKIELPSSLKQIDSQAFCECSSLVEVIIPEHLERMNGTNIFGNWSNFYMKITSLNPTPPEIEEGAFMWFLYDNADLYVPDESIDLYKTTFPWSKFKNIYANSTTNIENTVTDNHEDAIDYNLPYEIYNTNGIKVGSDIKSLPCGMYIIHQGHTTKKITII